MVEEVEGGATAKALLSGEEGKEVGVCSKGVGVWVWK